MSATAPDATALHARITAPDAAGDKQPIARSMTSLHCDVGCRYVQVYGSASSAKHATPWRRATQTCHAHMLRFGMRITRKVMSVP
jgi:hypothetical protein